MNILAVLHCLSNVKVCNWAAVLVSNGTNLSSIIIAMHDEISKVINTDDNQFVIEIMTFVHCTHQPKEKKIKNLAHNRYYFFLLNTKEFYNVKLREMTCLCLSLIKSSQWKISPLTNKLLLFDAWPFYSCIKIPQTFKLSHLYQFFFIFMLFNMSRHLT